MHAEGSRASESAVPVQGSRRGLSELHRDVHLQPRPGTGVLKASIKSTWGLVRLHRVEGQRKVTAYRLVASARGMALLGSRIGMTGISRESHLGGETTYRPGGLLYYKCGS